MARRFRFRLETLLRVRRIAEREQQRQLAARQAELARLDKLIAELLAEIERWQQVLLGEQSSAALDATSLSRQRAWIAYLRQVLHVQQALRGSAVQEVEAARRRLSEARVRTRTVETLRERRWQEYRQERESAEQTEADELARQLLYHARAVTAPRVKPSEAD
ncbi:MAG: hypothetical protein CHACPFDD_00989 [Phycisphaerae bacterium]|nr:hypothetical protein [Phycisphaerae bacterium]